MFLQVLHETVANIFFLRFFCFFEGAVSNLIIADMYCIFVYIFRCFRLLVYIIQMQTGFISIYVISKMSTNSRKWLVNNMAFHAIPTRACYWLSQYSFHRILGYPTLLMITARFVWLYSLKPSCVYFSYRYQSDQSYYFFGGSIILSLYFENRDCCWDARAQAALNSFHVWNCGAQNCGSVEVDMVVGFGWLSEIEDVPLVAVTTFWEFGKVDVLFWDFVSTAHGRRQSSEWLLVLPIISQSY